MRTGASAGVNAIVSMHPKAVAKLLYDKGYVPPKNKEELIKAAKELLNMQGQRFMRELRNIQRKKSFAKYDEESSYDEKENSDSYSPCGCGGKCKGKKSGEESSFCGCGGAVSSFDSGSRSVNKEDSSSKIEQPAIIQRLQKAMTIENALTIGAIFFSGLILGAIMGRALKAA